MRRRGVIVDSYWMIADDKLHVGVFGRNDLTDALGPDRAVHHPDALHFHHQFILTECRILRLKPIEALGRPNLLEVDISEQRLKVPMPFGLVLTDERSCGAQAL